MSWFGLLNTIATYLLLVYNLFHFKQKRELLSGPSLAAMRYFGTKENGAAKLLAKPVFWTVIEICVISCLQYMMVGFLNTGTAKLFNTGANYFGIIYFAPILVVAFCLLVRIDPLAQMDLITPAYPLTLALSKVACQFAGCCRGIEWIHGLYNPFYRRIEFPAPLLEAAVALLLFIFLQSFKKKFKKGTIFPIYLTAFSAIRFFTEFTRCEPAVLWGLKAYHYFCIVGVILGMIEYIAALKYDTWMQKKAEGKASLV